MSFVINTNVMSLVAQQNLSKSNSMLNQAITRLSSGKKINSAADDAAGQAISNRMSAQITGLTQAKSNANDGISLAQTTEGALDQINDNLQRIRQLSVQAANGTNTTEDRQSIQDEIDERLSEIDRVAEQTTFNGVNVLSSGRTISIQVGANDDETIDISLDKINANTLGLATFNVAGPVMEASGATPAAADGTSVLSDIYGSTTSITKTSVTETNAGDFTKAVASRLGVASGNVAIDGGSKVLADDAGNLFVAVKITAANSTESDNLALRGIEVASGSFDTFYLAVDADDLTTAASTATLTLTAKAAEDLNFNALSQGATQSPLGALDEALAQVDDLRSNLGAMQNRFDSAINNLSTTTNNLKESRSRIVDANYAEVVSAMSKSQILQQAGTAVLSQANQSQQSVLSLLR